MIVENTQTQMRKGILEYCILSIIAKGETYASDIIAELKKAQLLVVEGTLYPLLNPFKKQWPAHLQLGRINFGAAA